MFRMEKAVRSSDVVVLVIDASEGPKMRDKKLASMIAEEEKGCIILVNKWDLQKDESTQRKYGEELNHSLPFLTHVPIVFCSAQSGYNIRKSIDTIDYVAKQVSTQMGTGVLNRVIEHAFEKVQPPMVKGKRLKIYYSTQFGNRPIRIKLFVNNPAIATDAYKRYLLKNLRAHFGLEGAPIVMIYSRRRQLEREDGSPQPVYGTPKPPPPEGTEPKKKREPREKRAPHPKRPSSGKPGNRAKRVKREKRGKKRS
jgi:GTP-binding protein